MTIEKALKAANMEMKIHSRNEIFRNLIDFITTKFYVVESEINLDKSIIDEGIVDSFGLVEIVVFIQRYFDIVVSEEDMMKENFGSVNKIVDFIERRVD